MNKPGYILTILFILVFIRPGICQKIKFKHLSEQNGLSEGVVNCMIEDHFGFLWFGTEDGLNRYDGYNFRVFRSVPGDTNSLSDNNIWSLFEDSEGGLWIGTQDGVLNCFNPESEKFEHFRTSNNPVSGNSITCIYRDKEDILWLGTYKGGLCRLDIKRGTVLNWMPDPEDESSLSNSFVTSIYEDRGGNLWLGTYNGLCLFNKSSSKHPFTRFYHDPAKDNTLTDNIVWKIFPSKEDDEHIWVCTYNGLTYVNTTKKLFTGIIPDKNNPDKFSRSISSICEDFAGTEKHLWIGTYDGLVKLRLQGELSDFKVKANPDSVLRINKDQLKFYRWINESGNLSSINNNHINNILVDRSGVLWISGQEGIDYYAGQKDKFNSWLVHKNENPDFEMPEIKDVQAICETGKDLIWIGTNQGIYTLTNSGGNYKLTGLQEFSKMNIWSMAAGNDNGLWIGTYGNGLEYFNPDSKRIKKWKGDWFDSLNIGNPYVRAVHQDKTGAVWIGLWGVGLNRLDPETGKINRWHHESDNKSSLSYDDVWVIYEDSRGRIWIGTYGGGLNLFTSAGGGSFQKWSFSDGGLTGLSSNNILSICESRVNVQKDKTILWIGTTRGLNKLIVNNESDGKTGTQAVFENYPALGKFLTNSINSIEEDGKGHLWIGTNDGLIEFDQTKGILETYTVFDGLQSSQFNPNSAYKSSSGEIFLGSVNGFNVFHPDSIYHSAYNPPVMLTDFQVFNQAVPIRSDSPLRSSIITSKEIVLSYNQNVFSFQFAALDYNAPEVNQYAYKMEGFDNEWIYSGTRRYVTYTNLNPGGYVFKVKATNSDGIWNKTFSQINVVITPPFWGTWWFRGLILLVIMGILYSVYRFRLNRLLELERLRIKIASDLHDDIGSALTRISLESELLNTNADPESRKEGLSRIGNMSREIISSMSDVVWSIDSRNDSIEDLINRMKDFAFSLSSLRNTRVIFETKNLNMQKKLKVDLRQNIYLIFKEAMNNTFKYSISDEIKVELKNIDGEFSMIILEPISDFNPQKITGHGLRNMEMRAERIGGKIELHKGEGLKVVLKRAEI